MQNSGMHEPGLDLHEWETRWQQLLDVARESPADAAGEIDRLLEEMLGDRGLLEPESEAWKQFEAAREALRRYERDEAGAGDLAAALIGYREVYELLTTEHFDPPQRSAGGARSA